MLRTTFTTATAMFILAIMIAPTPGWTHCDTLDGPVVVDARIALSSGEVTPVLKWIPADDEKTLTAAFEHTLAVRTLGPEARELADRYFFETLVRIHRAGEGAPFTGLKEAGAPDPAIQLADTALANTSAEKLTSAMTAHLTQSLNERFERVVQAEQHKDDSVEAGRAFVAAYVEFVHTVEAVHTAIAGPAHDHGNRESK